jgi:hypothetical protein
MSERDARIKNLLAWCMKNHRRVAGMSVAVDDVYALLEEVEVLTESRRHLAQMLVSTSEWLNEKYANPITGYLVNDKELWACHADGTRRLVVRCE